MGPQISDTERVRCLEHLKKVIKQRKNVTAIALELGLSRYGVYKIMRGNGPSAKNARKILALKIEKDIR